MVKPVREPNILTNYWQKIRSDWSKDQLVTNETICLARLSHLSSAFGYKSRTMSQSRRQRGRFLAEGASLISTLYDFS
jgi:hypothetical protein